MYLSWCSGNICSYRLTLLIRSSHTSKNSLQTFKHVDENKVSFCFLFSFCWLSIIPGGLGEWDSAALLGTLWLQRWSKALIGWRLYVNISRVRNGGTERKVKSEAHFVPGVLTGMEGTVCRVKCKPQDTVPGIGNSEIWTFRTQCEEASITGEHHRLCFTICNSTGLLSKH